ncbi:hypothetical protein SNL152K_10711 [Streptomyces sp. NL15-2K]|nr:hypothetical protein SNL152K_10711 [Streptomyces sp. NL15-2K]
MLRVSSTPWAALLAEYVDALTELVAQGKAFDSTPEEYVFDQGHAGGCG